MGEEGFRSDAVDAESGVEAVRAHGERREDGREPANPRSLRRLRREEDDDVDPSFDEAANPRLARQPPARCCVAAVQDRSVRRHGNVHDVVLESPPEEGIAKPVVTRRVPPRGSGNVAGSSVVQRPPDYVGRRVDLREGVEFERAPLVRGLPGQGALLCADPAPQGSGDEEDGHPGKGASHEAPPPGRERRCDARKSGPGEEHARDLERSRDVLPREPVWERSPEPDESRESEPGADHRVVRGCGGDRADSERRKHESADDQRPARPQRERLRREEEQ